MKTLILIVLVIFAFSINAAAQDTLYSETFANGILQNTWYPGYNGNNMETEFMPGNPSGDTFVGKLGNDLSGGSVGQSYSGDPSWADYDLEAQVYIPVDEGTYYGLEFRVGADTNSYGYQYLAVFNPNNPLGLATQMRFRVRPSGGFPTNIKSWTGGEIPGGVPTTSGWHKLAVRAVGNQFWFYYDDQELPGCPYADNTYSSGQIGAYIWDLFLSPIYLYIDDIYVINTSTGIDVPQPGIVSGYKLHQNFPNPFNPNTTISFELADREFVQLDIYNNLGQRIRSLVGDQLTAGPHQAQWDGRDALGQEAPAGVYYYRIHAGSFQETNKMLLVR